MIIWINGAFGVGKTQTAYELNKVIEKSIIFDPESVGFFLGKLYRGVVAKQDFQEFDTWRKMVSSIIIEMSENTDKLIIVPMTITNENYYNEIVNPIKHKGFQFKSYTLLAKKETVEDRLKKRGDKNSWNFKQVDRCIESLSNETFEKHINTDDLSLYEVVDYICDDLSLNKKKLSSNNFNRLARRVLVTIKNIRILS